MRKLITGITLFSIISLFALSTPSLAQSPSNNATEHTVVHAVLFFSPTCPHCHKVIQETLLPMIDKYGDQLQILGIDVTQNTGAKLYQDAVKYYNIPADRRGVPTLIVADTILVGDVEIPQQFPAIVADALAADGIPWPSLPNLEIPPPTTPQANTITPTAAAPTTVQPIASTLPSVTNAAAASTADPAGTAVGWAVMVFMLIAIGYAVWRTAANWEDLADIFALDATATNTLKTWFIPVLALVGLGVAGYLTYIEVTQSQAVCGPIGHCNLVQASAYARIFGVHVAVLGLINYVGIIALWVGARLKTVRLANLSALALLGLTVFGVLFSVYLTWVELFLIKAVCAWCLASALITTLLMLVALIATTNLPYMDDDTPQVESLMP